MVSSTTVGKILRLLALHFRHNFTSKDALNADQIKDLKNVLHLCGYTYKKPTATEKQNRKEKLKALSKKNGRKGSEIGNGPLEPEQQQRRLGLANLTT